MGGQHDNDTQAADQTKAPATRSSTPMEPESMEYISALAAGNQAQLLADIAPATASPASTTVALAVAAARTGGRLVCIRDDPRSLDDIRRHLHRLGLAAAADFQLAMDAYLHTLQLCRGQHDYDTQAADQTKAPATRSSTPMEPESMEYISALAAGNQAQLLADIAPAAASPASTTVALAVAAARTGGRLVCIRDDPRCLDDVRRHLHRLGLAAAADFQLGRPSEAVRRLSCLDFAVVHGDVEDRDEVLKAMDMNPKGAIVVVTNIFQGQQGSSTSNGHSHGSRGCCHGQVVGKKGKSMVLPIGNGMEVTKIGRVGGLHMQKQKLFVSCRSTPKRTFFVCDGMDPPIFF